MKIVDSNDITIGITNHLTLLSRNRSKLLAKVKICVLHAAKRRSTILHFKIEVM